MGKAKAKDMDDGPRYSIGDQIKILRWARGVSQRGMLDETGISKATFSTSEVGRRHPRGETLQKLADRYGVPLIYYPGPHAEPTDEELWAAAEALAARMGWAPARMD